MFSIQLFFITSLVLWSCTVCLFCEGAPASSSAITLESGVYDIQSEQQTSAILAHRITGQVHLTSVWQDTGAEDTKLLRLQLKSPKLYTRPIKSDSDDFIEQSSKLEKYENGPFYALWSSGVISKVFIGENEDLGLVNYKKGIISLFQFQILDMEKNETDVNGHCTSLYMSTSPRHIRKMKNNCILPTNYDYKKHPERILSALTESNRLTSYYLGNDDKTLETVLASESHEFKMAMKPEALITVDVFQRLVLKTDIKPEKKSVSGNNLKEVIANLRNQGENLKEQTLTVTKESSQCKEDCPNLQKLIKDNREFLKSSSLGTTKSAKVFLELLNVIRKANADEILKSLKGVKNKEILQQLCDLVGFAQTIESHRAAKKFFNFDSDYDVDNIARYLWALSIGSHPQESVISDVLKLSEDANIAEKLKTTMILTVASMCYKFVQQNDNNYNNKVIEKVKNSLTYDLSKCESNECKVLYLRAFKNMRHPETIPILLKEAEYGQKSVSVTAMKALRAMPSQFWDENVVKTCLRIFYQLRKKYDSSSRTLAVDVVLESRPSEEIVKDLIFYLSKYDKEFEVKQFLYQKLLMIASKCEVLKYILFDTIKKNPQLNNWHVLGQRGQTTVLKRSFMENEHSNGSLISVQEISGGVLKRGHVDILLEADGEKKEIFSLGLFAGGLSSFMGGSNNADENNTEEEEEIATAGMELSVQGVQIRPFVFFTGQGELMGHVWSGTASDRTTAFQALLLLQDHSERIVLGNGITAELSLLGAASFDLAGQITLSIWSRVAHSVVEKNAGIVVQGLVKTDTSFINTEAEFLLGIEPKLNLVSDLDFYSDISLCMQLKQPDTILRHNIHKIQTIPDSNHKIRKSTYKKIKYPGKTYFLNQKNNEMCNLIHGKS